MTDTVPVVKSVTDHDDRATIEFEDGHRAVFEAYSHGWGFQIEGLRHFFLFKGDQQVAQYDARLHMAGPRDDEHRFVQVAEGYTVGMIASYWEAAQTHVGQEYFHKPYNEGRKCPDELWFAWRATCEGGLDLDKVKRGLALLPGTPAPNATSPQGASSSPLGESKVP